MWEGDSGAVAVVNPEGKVTGIITDRDLAMAMAAKNRGSAQILVREITSGELFSCTPEDELGVAIERMRTHRVRRLPVLDPQGQLLGMLSLTDMALAANGSSGAHVRGRRAHPAGPVQAPDRERSPVAVGERRLPIGS